MGRAVVHDERAEDRDLPRLRVILERCRKSARYSRDARRRITFHLKEAMAIMLRCLPSEAAPEPAHVNGVTNGAVETNGKKRAKKAAAA